MSTNNAMAVADLYTLLGVARDASAGDIKAAYRKAAKTKHPDQGGSREEFDALSRAKDILLDPKRRAKYDATGDDSDVPADNANSEVLSIIEEMIGEFINDEAKPFERVDMMLSMKKAMHNAIRNAHEKKASGQRWVIRATAIADRFSFKKTSPLLPLHKAMRDKIATQQRRVDSVDDDIKRFERVLKALDTMNYKWDEPPNYPPMQTGSPRGFGFGRHF